MGRRVITVVSTLAYYDPAIITAIKSFIRHTQDSIRHIEVQSRINYNCKKLHSTDPRFQDTHILPPEPVI
jgi:hypothetical protein